MKNMIKPDIDPYKESYKRDVIYFPIIILII
jgi:hypothetical protein